MATISVLVVDDHRLFADALCARLAREPDLGPIEAAYDAVDAGVMVVRMRPAVVVLDLLLGDGQNGLDLAESIRQLSPRSKAIVLTAVESVCEVIPGLAHGVRAWLPKTVGVDRLVQVIRGVHVGEAWLAPDLLGRVISDLVIDADQDPLDRPATRRRPAVQCPVDRQSRGCSPMA